MSHDHVGIYFFISCDRTKKKKKDLEKNGRKEKRETYSNPSLAAAVAWTFFWFCCSRGGVCSGKDLFLTIESLSHHHPFRFSICSSSLRVLSSVAPDGDYSFLLSLLFGFLLLHPSNFLLLLGHQQFAGK